MSSHEPVIKNGDADEPQYEVVIIESTKAFPAEGGVLSEANIHHNPDWPDQDELPDGCASSGDLAVCIRYVADGSIEPTYADMFYVGKRRPRQHVHARLIESGWYSILPLAGKYSIFLINLSERDVSATVHVDGERVGWTGLRSWSVSELSGFQIKPAESSEDAQVNENKFGTIEVFFREVAAMEKRIKEESRPTTTASQQQLENGGKLVPEHKKFHMTYLSVTKAPTYSRQAPGTRVRQWTDGDLIADDGLINGCLRINYRATPWAYDARWLTRTQQATEDDDDENDDDEPTSGDNSNRASQHRRGNKRQAGNMAPSAAPNPKRRKRAEDPNDGIVNAITRDSSVKDFFNAMAKINSRNPEDYQDVMNALNYANVTNIDMMLQVAKDDWLGYLPRNLNASAKRGLLAAITNLLRDVERRLGVLDVT